jgi:hypothetical protein
MVRSTASPDCVADRVDTAKRPAFAVLNGPLLAQEGVVTIPLAHPASGAEIGVLVGDDADRVTPKHAAVSSAVGPAGRTCHRRASCRM